MSIPPSNGGLDQVVLVSGLQVSMPKSLFGRMPFGGESACVHQAECGLDVKFAFQVDGNGGKSPRISHHFNA